MTISTAHLRELARRVIEARKAMDDGDSPYSLSDRVHAYNVCLIEFQDACSPKSIAALCDRADEVERDHAAIHMALTYLDCDRYDDAKAVLTTALSKGGE